MTYQSILSIYLTAILLISGPISCGPDKIKLDSFRISPPVLREGQNNHSLANAQPIEAKKWSAQAEMTFGSEVSSSNTKVQVISFCSGEKGDSTIQRTFASPAKIELYKMLPVLTLMETATREFQCSFQFKASNSVGSAHLFRIEKIKVVVDPKAFSLILKNRGAFEVDSFNNSQVMSLNEVKDLEAISTQSGSKFSLTCQFHRLDFPINDYRLAKSDGPNKVSIEEFPRQNCRIVESKNGEIISLSRVLPIQFPQYEWPVKKGGPRYRAEVLQKIISPSWIKNNRPYPVWLKWPVGAQGDLLVHAFPSISGFYTGGNFKGEIKIPYSLALIETKGDTKLIEMANHRYLRLAPNAEVLFATIVKNRVHCSISNNRPFEFDTIYSTQKPIGPNWLETESPDPEKLDSVPIAGPIEIFGPLDFSTNNEFAISNIQIVKGILSQPAEKVSCSIP